jgi:hypothetical protein
MQVELTILLAAIIVNEGGEYLLPVSQYDALVGVTDRGIAFDIVDEGLVRMYITDIQEEPSGIIVPNQGG